MIRILENRVIVCWPFFIDLDDCSRKNLPSSQKAFAGLTFKEILFGNLAEEDISQGPLSLLNLDKNAVNDLRARRVDGHELSKAPFWQVGGIDAVTEDLHPHVRSILHGCLGDNAEPVTSRDYTLSASHNFLTVLNGKYGDKGPGMEMSFPAEASKRLGVNSVYLRHQKLQFSIFRTGVGFLVSEMTFHNGDEVTPLDESLFLQALNTFCRGDKRAPRLRWREYEKDMVEFEVDDLGKPILNDKGKQIIKRKWQEKARQAEGDFKLPPFFKEIVLRTTKALYGEKAKLDVDEFFSWHRLFSYSGLKLDDGVEMKEVRGFMAKSASKQTEVYRSTSEANDAKSLVLFEDVLHSFDIQGVASAVVCSSQPGEEDINTQPSDFHIDFIDDKLSTAYAPLVLIGYHEHLALLKMTHGSSHFVETGNTSQIDRDTLVGLRKVMRRMLNFRLNYRFSHASRIANHNLFYERLRYALSLDKLLSEVSDDVKEVESFLDYEQERSLALFGAIAAGLLFTTGWFGMNFVEIADGLHWFNPAVLSFMGVVMFFVLLFQQRRFGCQNGRMGIVAKGKWVLLVASLVGLGLWLADLLGIR